MQYAYLCIFIAALFFSMQFVFSKLYQKNSDGALLSILWMIEFQAIWMLLIFGTINHFVLQTTSHAVIYALFYSLSNVVCSLASIWALSLGKMATVTLFTMIGGQAIPFVYGLIFTGAHPTWLDYLGFVIILLSCMPNVLLREGNTESHLEKAVSPKEKKKGNVFLILCLLTFFGNGFVSVFSDVNAKSQYGAKSNDFLILCALWALLFGTVLVIGTALHLRKAGIRGMKAVLGGVGKSFTMGSILLVFLIVGFYTVANGVGNIFSLRAAGIPGMQSSVQFPILNSVILVLTAFLGRIIFHEKLNKKDMLSIVLAIIGILLFLASFLIYGN